MAGACDVLGAGELGVVLAEELLEADGVGVEAGAGCGAVEVALLVELALGLDWGLTAAFGCTVCWLADVGFCASDPA